MKLSKKGIELILEATASTIIGLVHGGAGIVFTGSMIMFHFWREKDLWHEPPTFQIIVRQPTQPLLRQCPLLQALNAEKRADEQ